MIDHEILEEKYRIQKKLATESISIHDYLARAQQSARQISKVYGFPLQYTSLPNTTLNRTPVSPRRL
jgi:hypothetical protein